MSALNQSGHRSKLTNSRDAGSSVFVVSVAVGVALFYLDFRYPEIAWRKQYAHVAAYAARLEVRPSFQQTKPA